MEKDDWEQIAALLLSVNKSLDDDEIEIAPSTTAPGRYVVIRHMRQLELVDASLAEVKRYLVSLKLDG
jgi:hypothetical protein